MKCDLIHRISRELSLEFVVNISSVKEFKFNVENTLYKELDYWKIVLGDYGVDNDSVINPDLLHALAPYLLTTLKMMDRIPNEVSDSFDDRMQMYFNHIRYWSRIIDDEQIECFISMNFPHEVYDYVIYSLCKTKGIKTLFFTQTQVLGLVQLLDNIEDNDIKLGEYADIDLNLRTLSPVCEKHLAAMTTSYQKPFYMEINQEQLDFKFSLLERVKKIIKINLRRLVKLNRFFHYSTKDYSKRIYLELKFGIKADKNLLKYYSSIATPPDLTLKYIYVPLHFQPECTTCPQGDVFVYQELMLAILLETLPNNTFLFVKEHPFQGVQGRSEKFYEKFLKNEKIVWIKTDISSVELIKHSMAVATVTGSAAWESLFLGKKVLLFGSVFFQYAPGVFQVRNLLDCKKYFSEIIKTDEKVGIDDIKKFLIHLEERSIHGWTDPLYESLSDIGYHDNLNNLVINLVKRLS